MSQAKDELVARAQDPNAELETLHQLAQNYPGLRPYIATNPRTYPALLEWLGTLGDPAVDAALASRAGHPQSAQSPQGSPQLAVVSPPGAQPGPSSTMPSEAPTQVTLPYSLQSDDTISASASASGAFSAAGANTQVDGFRAAGDPTVSDSTFRPTQAIPSQSPARPVQPALQQTFQQSTSMSQAHNAAIPVAAQASPNDAGILGVGTEDDASAPSSFLPSNRILLILAVIVVTVLVFLATWYFSGGDGENSPMGGDTQPTAESSQGANQANASPSTASASPKASATPSASATPTLKAPAPGNALELSTFDAPSGNITCTLGSKEITCVINEHAATDSCPASKPLTVKIGSNGQSSQSCGSNFAPSGVSLSYSSSAKNSDFACTSAEAGMQCWSQVSGEGFTLSREGVESTSHAR